MKPFYCPRCTNLINSYYRLLQAPQKINTIERLRLQPAQPVRTLRETPHFFSHSYSRASFHI